MKFRHFLPFGFLLFVYLQFLAACNSQSSIGPAETTVTPTDIPEAWATVRAALPSDIPVYMPTNMPARFGPPELDEVVATDHAYGPHYTVVYSATTAPGNVDTIVFILNIGKGSWSNALPPENTEPIAVDGASGEMYSTPDNLGPSYNPAKYYGVTWQKQGQSYQIKAISTEMTNEEIKQIIESLVPINKYAKDPSPVLSA